MKKARPKLPNRKIGEGDYTKDRKKWANSITGDDIRKWREEHADVELLAELERIKKRKRKAS